MRPAEVCGCSRKPASERSAITFRMEAGLRPSRLERASVRDPTGSPVEINVSTMAVRISRSRFPILGSAGMMHYVSYVNPSGQSRQASDSFYLTILDAEGWVWEQSCDAARNREASWVGHRTAAAKGINHQGTKVH